MAAKKTARKRTKKADLTHIADTLQFLASPVANLTPDPNNVRDHNATNIDAIAHSLYRFGQQKPIVALVDGTVIAGNGTMRAAEILMAGGLVVHDAGDVIALSPDPRWANLAVSVFAKSDDAIAFAIADNKTAELATWDFDGLSKQLAVLGADLLQATGFAQFEVDMLTAASFDPPPGDANGFSENAPRDAAESRKVSLSEPEWAKFIEACDSLSNESTPPRKITRGEAVAMLCERYLA